MTNVYGNHYKKEMLKMHYLVHGEKFLLTRMKKYFGSSTNFQGEDTSSEFLFLFAQFVFKYIWSWPCTKQSGNSSFVVAVMLFTQKIVVSIAVPLSATFL